MLVDMKRNHVPACYTTAMYYSHPSGCFLASSAILEDKIT